MRKNNYKILIEISNYLYFSFLVIVTYREYKRQKERSEQQDWVSKEHEEKKAEMAKRSDKGEGGSK